MNIANTENQSGFQKTRISRRAFFFLSLAACVLLFAAAEVIYEIYLPHPARRGVKEIVIPQGYGLRTIGDLLKKEAVIGSKWAFVFYVWVRAQASDLKPGRYVFFETAAIPDIARDLVLGVSRERAITIPEGWSIADIARYFAEHAIASRDSAMDLFLHPPEEIVSRFPFLSGAPKGSGLEGYLFPDTYRVFQDAGLKEVVVKMLENFDRKLEPDIRAEIARPVRDFISNGASRNKTLFEIVTMASLIEKEIVSDEDRAVVSGILWKRLDAGIPLQVDATIAYAQAQNSKRKAQNNGKISLDDTRIDSPYNTYKYRGLPQGPISNPGLSAIRAAVYPKSSPYLYYLSAPDGRTIFSRTLEEHNAAKAKYLR